MSRTITMERPFGRKARATMNTDLTVEITDLAWTITKAELAGDYLHDDEESDPLSRDQLWLSNMAFHRDFTAVLAKHSKKFQSSIRSQSASIGFTAISIRRASKLRDGGPTRSRMNRQVLSSIAHSSRINSMFRGIWHATFTRTIWVASSCRRVIAVNSAANSALVRDSWFGPRRATLSPF